MLLAHVPAGLDWLPDVIPVRETKALVLGTLLRERRTRERVRALLPERLTTATDVLRLLAVWSGGEAGLLEPPRLRSLPRPLRRDLLAVLDGLDPALLVEDVLRHEDLWKRAVVHSGDLERRGFLWTDVHLPDDEGYHSVRAHQEDLARIGRDLFQYFSTGRTTLWELAGWHAAARCSEVVVLRRTPRPSDPDELWTYRRGSGEDTAAFAARLVGLRDPDGVLASADVEALAGTAASGRSVFLALVDGEVAPAGASGSVYRLLPGPVDGCGLEQLAAGDLVAALG